MSKNKTENHLPRQTNFVLLISGMILFIMTRFSYADQPLTAMDVLMLKSCREAEISPDGKWIAYTVSVPRKIDEAPGGAYAELYLAATGNNQIIPFITGEVNVSRIRWSPSGDKIGFLMKRGENARQQVWEISTNGGEAQPLTRVDTDVLDFNWHPLEKQIFYISEDRESLKERKLEQKGYNFIYYQENLRHRNLYRHYISDSENIMPDEQLTHGVTVWEFCISPNGKKIAAAISAKNLIDQYYMFRKIYLLDLASNELQPLSNNPGKLGNFVFSPDSKKLAYAAALSRNDNQVSQAFVIDVAGGKEKNLTIPEFQGHVNRVDWLDKNRVLYLAGEGVWSTLSAVDASGGKRNIILDSKKNGIIFQNISVDAGHQSFAMVGHTAEIPGDIYYWRAGSELKRLTMLNPWLKERDLAIQELIRYTARDGQAVEGILIYPLNYNEGERYPLLVYVHGGPEHHNYNEWLTSYSTPGQVMAGRGYAVFFPNYRASTGYGVKFAMEGFGDPAGKEFDDIADGIDFLVNEGIADKVKVGLAGGSYGGYASAWFATYYTDYVRAVCMFVGVSDLISRMGTTDIPYEELYVHSGKKLEEMWDLALKRSPIYWAHQSKTAVLIYGGAADTRVHPSQSLELYWRLKMNDHPAVRLVQYPGEKHGNSRQPGRNDVIHRQIQWFDWYVRDLKPLDGPLPPLDISDRYDLDLTQDVIGK
jgi:dipeptidyl aminopeptidase/acylaminoacyl peptidase